VTTSVMPGPARRERPFGVSVLAVLAAISFAFGVLGLLAGAAVDSGGWLIGLAFTVMVGFSAYGLWNLRPWARPLSMIGYGLATLEALLLLTGGVINSNLIVGPSVVIYLMRADIRDVFEGR
jgi:hypothetical protein